MKEIMRQFRVIAGQEYKLVVRIHHDDDSSFKGEVYDWIRDSGVEDTNTGGYNAVSNQRVESRIGKLKRTVRKILLTATGGTGDYKLLWGHAFKHANELINNTPEAGESAPVTKLNSKQKPIDFEKEGHVFGAQAAYWVPREKRGNTLDPVADLGIWVGMERNYRLIVPIKYDRKKHRWTPHGLVHASTVQVTDTVFPLARVPREGGSSSAKDFDTFVDQFSPFAMINEVYEMMKIVGKRVTDGREEFNVRWKGYSSKHNTWEPKAHIVEYGGESMLSEFEKELRDKQNVTSMYTAIQDMREKDTWDYVDTRVAMENMKRHNLPGNLLEWKMAATNEREGLMTKYGRLKLLTGSDRVNILKDRKYVRMRMNPEIRDGRKKMRWLKLGNQMQRLEAEKSDSPTARTSSIRMVVFAPESGGDYINGVYDPWVVVQKDAEKAFLQSISFSDNGEPVRYVVWQPYKGAELLVFEQTGSIYGEYDASMRFYKTIAPVMEHIGFTVGKNDPCVFYNKDLVVRAGLHVDDLLAKGRLSSVNKFIHDLEHNDKRKVTCKDTVRLSPSCTLRHLGMDISVERRNERNWYKITQQKDIEEYIDTQGVEAHKAVDCPMPQKGELLKDPTILSEEQASEYRSQYGTIQHFTRCTRWDLAQVMSRLATYMAKPTVSAKKALRRVMLYLKTWPSICVEGYVGTETLFEFCCDSDHAGDRQLGKQSRTGYFAFLNGVPVDWMSRKQCVTSIGSAEAEIYALSEAVKRAKSLQWAAEDSQFTEADCFSEPRRQGRWGQGQIYIHSTQSAARLSYQAMTEA